jgi:hypothetical protein
MKSTLESIWDAGQLACNIRGDVRAHQLTRELNTWLAGHGPLEPSGLDLLANAVEVLAVRHGGSTHSDPEMPAETRDPALSPGSSREWDFVTLRDADGTTRTVRVEVGLDNSGDWVSITEAN